MLSPARQALKERCHKVWKYGIAHPEEMFLKCLKIKDKNNNIIPFALNKAQTKVMEAIHRQLETTGKIRLVIIKSRQQGDYNLMPYHHDVADDGTAIQQYPSHGEYSAGVGTDAF